MNPINSQIWEKYSAPAIKDDRNTKMTFVKYKFANLVETKKKRGIQKGEEKNENILKMPLFTSLINQQDLVFTKKQSQLLKKRIKEREN